MGKAESVLSLRKTWLTFMFEVGQLALALLIPLMFVTPIYWFDISDSIPRHGGYRAHLGEIVLWVLLLIVVVLLLWLMSITFGSRLAGRPDVVISALGIETGLWRKNHRSWELLGEAVIDKRPRRLGPGLAECVKIPGSEQARIVGTDVIILDEYGMSPHAVAAEVNRIRASPETESPTVGIYPKYRDLYLRYSMWCFGPLVAALFIWLQFGRALID